MPDLKNLSESALLERAIIFHTQGEKQQAERLYREVLHVNPQNPDAWHLLGVLAHQCGQHEVAVDFIGQAIELRPDCADYWSNLGEAYRGWDQQNKAMESYQKAFQIDPNHVESLMQYGLGHFRKQRYKEAILFLSRACAGENHSPEVWYYLGAAQAGTGRFQEALVSFDKALAVGLETPELHVNRGLALKDLGRMMEAAQSFERALALKPDLLSALNNMGAIATDLGMITEAADCVRLLIQRAPGHASAHNNLGKLLTDSGKAQEGILYYQQAMELAPQVTEFQHNFLLGLNNLPDRTPKEIFQLHQEWGERVSKTIQAHSWSKSSALSHPKIRIGYVSADICHHPVALFIEPYLIHYDRTRFEVFIYADVKRSDAVTERLKVLPDVWRDTTDLSHPDLARRIKMDEIDILVDLSGHTGMNRMELFALKPARLQATYLGYPASTGLGTIDFRITDSWADPVGMTEFLHTERLVRLSTPAWCYQMPKESPPAGSAPSSRTGYVTFGCFNRLSKLNPTLFEWWVALLKRVPGSHLKLKTRSFGDPIVRNDWMQFFVQRGIAVDRLDFGGATATIASHLEAHHEVDMMLDSYPYHGTTITCEALWMGVPVVTLGGQSHVSRVGVSLLNAVGLPELVASTWSEYIEIAARLAEDSSLLEALHRELRPRFESSLLMNPIAFAAAMDHAFSEMYHAEK